MPAKSKKNTTKRTFKRKSEVSSLPKLETSLPIAQTVIPDVPSVQPLPVDPVQPLQPQQPEQTAQPIQPLQAAVVTPTPVVSGELTQEGPTSVNKQPELPNAEAVISSDPQQVSEKPNTDLPQSSNSNGKNGKKNILLSMVFIVLLGVAILGGVFLYRQVTAKSEGKNTSEASSSKQKTQVTPLPTKEEIDLAKYKIKVQNGSGIAGEAGKEQENLEAEGFKVASIGNADSSNYDKTIVKAKKSVEKEFLDKLEKVLKTSFALGKTETLDSDKAEDVIVIIGSKKSE